MFSEPQGQVTCGESSCCGALRFMSFVGSLISGVVAKTCVRLLEVTPKSFAGKGEMLLGRQEGARKSVINTSFAQKECIPSVQGKVITRFCRCRGAAGSKSHPGKLQAPLHFFLHSWCSSPTFNCASLPCVTAAPNQWKIFNFPRTWEKPSDSLFLGLPNACTEQMKQMCCC